VVLVLAKQRKRILEVGSREFVRHS
jgi:hypothetical protein